MTSDNDLAQVHEHLSQTLDPIVRRESESKGCALCVLSTFVGMLVHDCWASYQ